MVQHIALRHVVRQVSGLWGLSDFRRWFLPSSPSRLKLSQWHTYEVCSHITVAGRLRIHTGFPSFADTTTCSGIGPKHPQHRWLVECVSSACKGSDNGVGMVYLSCSQERIAATVHCLNSCSAHILWLSVLAHHQIMCGLTPSIPSTRLGISPVPRAAQFTNLPPSADLPSHTFRISGKVRSRSSAWPRQRYPGIPG